MSQCGGMDTPPLLDHPKQVTFTLTVDIPDTWFEFVGSSDLFFHSYCGYWMHGCAFDPALGWLACEIGDRGLPSDEDEAAAHAMWQKSETGMGPIDELPDGWIRIDREVARRAYVEGVKQYGLGWYDAPRTDANTYDRLIQMVVFGKQRYAG